VIASVLSGTGLWIPSHSVSNAELVASHTSSVERFNREHAEEIADGRLEARDETTDRFIVKASGIQSRYVIEKSGLLDPTRLRPRLPTRGEDELSIQAEICTVAARQALERARREPVDVDAVIVACSNLQRAYPAVAIEVQDALGIEGWAYDLNVACSSATFGIQAGVDAIANGSARRVLVLNPELTSGHNNFELRDYHFIFGDACAAVLIEAADTCDSPYAFDVLSTRLRTKFSNNIRNDFGFLNRSETEERGAKELVFRQNGRQVFREVCPMVAAHLLGHLADEGVKPSELRRLWLHQANLSMNQLIAKTVLGRAADKDEAPVILDEFANTSSAGSVIAFHRSHEDFESGQIGVLCSFGAGYSIGSVLLRRR
jgi:beta-ketodecanoyl-[acyl-carrier-protein] synthase